MLKGRVLLRPEAVSWQRWQWRPGRRCPHKLTGNGTSGPQHCNSALAALGWEVGAPASPTRRRLALQGPSTCLPCARRWRPRPSTTLRITFRELSMRTHHFHAVEAPWRRRHPAFQPLIICAIGIQSGPRTASSRSDTGQYNVSSMQSWSPSQCHPGQARDLRLSAWPVGHECARYAGGSAFKLGIDKHLHRVSNLSPLALGPILDVILGRDFSCSHDFFFTPVVLWRGPAWLLVATLMQIPSGAPLPPRLERGSA